MNSVRLLAWRCGSSFGRHVTKPLPGELDYEHVLKQPPLSLNSRGQIKSSGREWRPLLRLRVISGAKGETPHSQNELLCVIWYVPTIIAVLFKTAKVHSRNEKKIATWHSEESEYDAAFAVATSREATFPKTSSIDTSARCCRHESLT